MYIRSCPPDYTMLPRSYSVKVLRQLSFLHTTHVRLSQEQSLSIICNKPLNFHSYLHSMVCMTQEFNVPVFYAVLHNEKAFLMKEEKARFWKEMDLRSQFVKADECDITMDTTLMAKYLKRFLTQVHTVSPWSSWPMKCFRSSWLLSNTLTVWTSIASWEGSHNNKKNKNTIIPSSAIAANAFPAPLS